MPVLTEIPRPPAPEALFERLADRPGAMLLRSGGEASEQARYSIVVAEPFLRLRAFGSRCELTGDDGRREVFGDPWRLLSALLARCELADEPTVPFPLGGAFGYWSYDLKGFVESRLARRAINDLELPDCDVGFHDSLVVIDHHRDCGWIVSTGLAADGTRDPGRAESRVRFWERLLAGARPAGTAATPDGTAGSSAETLSTLPRERYIAAVEQAQKFIRSGDIYQVNLAQRLTAICPVSGWHFFRRLSERSPAPFAAFLQAGDFQLASSSPELFLRLGGRQMRTRPIKGTRPRSADPGEDLRLAEELQASPKERAELVMITDLLRNDLGRVCEYGSVRVPDLFRLERFAQVQHLVATVEGRLRPEISHVEALAASFPGGSITGAPKFRAMEIIDDLEPVTRGPYTGCLGYLGFNQESQLSILIRTAVIHGGQVHFHVGAGIVADSEPEAEFAETEAKAGGFRATLRSLGRV